MFCVTTVVVALLVSCGSGIAYGQFGLERIPSADGNVCSPNVMYECNTTGAGTAEFGISSSVISRSHASYPEETPDGTVEMELDGDFNATNFIEFRSNNETCNVSSCNTYRAELSIRVNSKTRCKVITCATEFSGDRSPFGNETIQWLYPPPTLKVDERSMNSATVSLKSGAPGCSDITYEVTTNCGDCSPAFNTTDTTITCGNLKAEDGCNMTARSMWDCGGYSDSRMVTVQRFEATAAPMSNSDTVAVGVGVGLGLGIPLVLGLSMVPLVILLVVRYCGKRRKGYNAYSKNISGVEDQLPDVAVDSGTGGDIPLGPIHTNESGVPNTNTECVESPKEQEATEEAPARTSTPAPAPSDPPQDMSKNYDANTSRLHLVDHDENNVTAQASPMKSAATEKSTAPSGAPHLPEKVQENTEKVNSEEQIATSTDAPGQPLSPPAPTSTDAPGQPPSPPAPTSTDAPGQPPSPPAPTSTDAPGQPPSPPAPTSTDAPGPPPSPPAPTSTDAPGQPPSPPAPTSTDAPGQPPSPPAPTSTDAPGQPPSPPAQESPKEPGSEATEDSVFESDTPQHAKQTQASQKKPEVAKESTAVVSGTPQLSQQAQSAEKNDEEAMVVGSRLTHERIKSNGSYETQVKTPPRSQVSESRGMPDTTGIGPLLHNFNDIVSEASQRKPGESLVEDSSIDSVAERNNTVKSTLNQTAMQEGASSDVSTRPGQAHTGREKKDEITLESGAGRSLIFLPVTCRTGIPTSRSTESDSKDTKSTIVMEENSDNNLTLQQQVAANREAINNLAATTKKEITTLCEKVEQLTRDLQKMTSRYEELDKKYKKEISAHEALKVKHAALEKNTEAERERLGEKNEELQREVQAKENTMQQMQTEILEKEKTIRQMEAEMQEMRRTIQEMHTENEQLKKMACQESESCT